MSGGVEAAEAQRCAERVKRLAALLVRCAADAVRAAEQGDSCVIALGWERVLSQMVNTHYAPEGISIVEKYGTLAIG